MPAKEVRLKRLLRDPDIATVVDVVGEGRTTVYGRKGQRLSGPDVDAADTTVPVTPAGGPQLGTVAGPRAEQVAAALVALVGRERARRELADEVLDMYREVNLLYALGQVLATARDRADLARRALFEATRHVTVDAAYLVLDLGRPEVAAVVGNPPTRIPDDLSRLRIDDAGAGAVLVAPLAFREHPRGALVLHRAERPFSAGDLKLTGAVAAQGAGVLERILDEEQRARAAARREEQLRRQVAHLQIQLDHERQAEQVDRITETEYFGGLRAQASDLRRIITDRAGPRGPTDPGVRPD